MMDSYTFGPSGTGSFRMRFACATPPPAPFRRSLPNLTERRKQTTRSSTSRYLASSPSPPSPTSLATVSPHLASAPATSARAPS